MQMYEERCPFLHLVNYVFAFVSFVHREYRTMNTINQSAIEMKRGEFLVKMCFVVSRVLSNNCTPTLESFGTLARTWREERGALEISSHADRFSALATPRRSSTTAPFDCSPFFPFFPSFFSSFIFLPFARLFFAFWVWRESRGWEGFFFLFWNWSRECFERIRVMALHGRISFSWIFS